MRNSRKVHHSFQQAPSIPIRRHARRSRCHRSKGENKTHPEEERGDHTPRISNRKPVFLRLELESADEERNNHCGNKSTSHTSREQADLHRNKNKALSIGSKNKDKIPYLPPCPDDDNDSSDDVLSLLSLPTLNHRYYDLGNFDCRKARHVHSSSSSWGHRTKPASPISTLIPHTTSSCESWI